MRNLSSMENRRTGRNARAIGPYSRAVGRAVVQMLADKGLKPVAMLRDERFTSNIYAMLKGESVITVDDLKAMADFLDVEPRAIAARASELLTAATRRASAAAEGRLEDY